MLNAIRDAPSRKQDIIPIIGFEMLPVKHDKDKFPELSYIHEAMVLYLREGEHLYNNEEKDSPFSIR